MKKYLTTLNEKEKWMLIATLLCLIFYCYYLFLYAPISHRVDQKSLQLKEKIATLEWMNTVKVKKKNSLEKQKIDNSQLLTIFATQLKDNSTLNAPYELQQTAAGDIELTFEAVDFNLFIAWLEKINSQYTINIKQFNAQHTSTAGIAHIMILINTA